jgi:hypothetical protein
MMGSLCIWAKPAGLSPLTPAIDQTGRGAKTITDASTFQNSMIRMQSDPYGKGTKA